MKSPDATDVACPAYLAPYQEMLRRHGPCFRALLWNSVESQVCRFGALDGLVDWRGATVVDAGCGRADLLAYLVASNEPFGRYVGIEAMPAFLAQCRAESGARVEFVEADFVADPGLFARLCGGDAGSIIVFSGSLNTVDPGQAVRVLDNAWDACGRGLAFNFLPSDPGARPRAKDTGPARRYDPRFLLGWALGRAARLVARRDYLADNDVTIVLYKR